MGDPRNVAGLPYNVGTCTTYGVSTFRRVVKPICLAFLNLCDQFDAHQAGFNCAAASKIQSYCDSADPYCCTGNDPNVHQGYGQEYGSQALAFVNSKLSGSGGSGPTSTTTSGPTSTGSSSGATQTHYGQCGGIGYSGPTQCASGYTCQVMNSYYSQCL